MKTYANSDLFLIIDKANVAESTKKNYKNILKGIEFVSENKSIIDLLQQPEILIDKLWSNINIKNKAGYVKMKDYLKVILALSKHDKKFSKLIPLNEWRKYFNEINDVVVEYYSQNEPTKRQQLGYISFNELILIRDKLASGSIEKLLLMLYTSIPPARNDYWNVEIIKSNEEPSTDNYLIFNENDAKLILRKYKTSKTYGNIETILPDELFQEIKLSLKYWPRKYLFTKMNKKKEQTGIPYSSSNSFNSWANKTLQNISKNKFLTLTMLRNIYVNRSDLNLSSASISEKKKIAKRMGHSWIEQQQYYSWHSWK